MELADYDKPKRQFLKKSILVGVSAGMIGLNLLAGCKEKEEEEVSPAEDLMREHGVLNRILLIYDSCKERLIKNEQFPPEALLDAATIIRNFIESYHEKLEEDYLFPRFKKANQLVDLVNVLNEQHQAGRAVTEQIIQLTKVKSISTEENQKLVTLLTDFNTMYRPHEAREDTVLFPAFRKIVSKHEYDSLGEDFEKKEHEQFGEDGFDVMVQKVSNIEKQLGIHDLSQFTPKT
jgi:hemerythrin-like domain-containing protein